jgi:aldose 1-epimerase
LARAAGKSKPPRKSPISPRARLAFEWTLTEGPKTWPFRFRATLDVVLREGRVALELAVVNQSGRPMPVGLGLHPYFRLPFEDGKREDYLLTIPAHERWIVDNQVLPTGKRALLRDVENWAEGRRLYSTIKLDDLFGDLERTGRRGETVASLQWLLGERRLEIAGGDTVRHWQVYTPPRDSIAIEPQTCSIDAFNLAAQGVDSGMKILAPDETFSMRAAFSFLPPDRGHIAPKASAAERDERA